MGLIKNYIYRRMRADFRKVAERDGVAETFEGFLAILDECHSELGLYRSFQLAECFLTELVRRERAFNVVLETQGPHAAARLLWLWQRQDEELLNGRKK